ncbi:UDP-N-acetylmuramoyl-L-alanine--D-glutamate ligase [Corynebacterium epidermidicanis]|uniref:UDP-N-acetylmuramoylalanine--D-glutamate ligase n=1 Tax=Corynebacterium epidermidicanis TaxID=1050174 RepID=A0A0G3GVE5_9CORY|nr:UDP-N-acetylmuramoyl-L-alanine--D-glutamate ligase [Corynebacterium epidermidicanis]AKK03523.1 UDP-N-acetylmuramoylalanine--D-glutamate ligase [Corynebacterium epidermidicanis]
MTYNSSPELPVELRGTVLVAGAGVSGLGCVRMLSDLGVAVVVADDNDTARLRIAEAFGTAHLSVSRARQQLQDFSAVVTSPGWRPDSPLLVDASTAGLPVIGDVELAWRLDRAGVFGEPHTWVVVTGTNGKTTTTAMTTAMLQAGGLRAASVGNIGVAVGDALAATERIDILVAELSSFQLHWSDSLRPAVGALLNIAEDHIDWHGSMLEYAAAKAKALLGHVAVVGVDDAYVVDQLDRLVAEGHLAETKVVGFTLNEPQAGQIGISEGQIVDRAFAEGLIIAPATGISPAGPAGQLDALAATAMARACGVDAEEIAAGLSKFEVSGHRGQVVHTFRGAQFVDNSKATNPHAAEAALSGLESVIWVAGGQLKGAEVHELVCKHAGNMKAAVLLGVDRQQFADALREVRPSLPVYLIDATDPAEAMAAAVSQAGQHLTAGDVVLLAPAAASLDMFSGMGQRGDMFAEAARAQFVEE